MKRFSAIRVNGWCQRGGLAALALLGLMIAHPASALPLFARQTGMACISCHTVYPELTHIGRQFKMNGYQLDNGKDIEVTTDDGDQMLALPAIPNLALFIQSGYTALKTALPDSQIPGASSLKEGIAFPQQVSILYGGKIAPHFGAFGQLTYDDVGGTIGIDNTDYRFVNQYVLPNKMKLTYGLDLNNNPTVQDAWNTVPAWGSPYVLTETAVPSLAAPQLFGEAYQVAGLTGYILLNEQLYLEYGIYRDARNTTTVGGSNAAGTATPLDSTSPQVVAGNSPYWRAAYEYDIDRWALEVGTYGAEFKVYPGNGHPLSGATDKYTDIAEDFQFQWIGEKNIATIKGTNIHEKLNLDASAAYGLSNPSDWINYAEIDAEYYYNRKYGVDAGWMTTTGSTDPILYAPVGLYGANGVKNVTVPTPGTYLGVTTSAISNPGTNALFAEVNYVPWLNVKMTLQWTHYTKFNGNKDNYDGVGRNASDNDTLYFNMWFAM